MQRCIAMLSAVARVVESVLNLLLIGQRNTFGGGPKPSQEREDRERND
ncbi:hypothetical protein [Sphingobium yanoikuyae]|nr:hypothetical protein [Sphingobium yanoikuyae]